MKSPAGLAYDRLLGILLLLAVVLACGLTPMQTDTWWQLRAGRDMWMSGRVLLTDLYSHTAHGEFWPNHEWLAELIYYGMYSAGGLAAVTLFATALIAGAWALSWRLTRGPALQALMIAAPALLPASLWWEPRPHAFSLLFMMVAALLLVERRFAWLPPLFLVWANCHGGVLLGFVLVTAGLAIHALLEPRLWRRSAAIAATCALAMTATPLGVAFWIEIPQSLQRISLYPLDEWRRTAITDLRVLPFWAIAVAFCAALYRNRAKLTREIDPRDAVLFGWAAILLPLAVLAIRNVGPFLMIAVPALTTLVPPMIGRSRRNPDRPALNVAIASIASLAVAVVLGWSYYHQVPKLRWTPVPEAALLALKACPDNLYNRYDEGGYLLWFAPDRKVFLDGRQDPYPPELVLEHIRMETQGGGYEIVFSRHRIRCAYLPNVSPTAAQLVAAGWKTLFKDDTWVVLSN